MSNADDYLKELQDFDSAQGKAQLRTLALEFHSTLARLPKLKQEIDLMLQQDEGINFAELVVRIEPPLEKATHLLLEMDMLSSELRNASEMQGFVNALEVTMTVRTVELLSKKFHELVREIPQKIAQEKQQAERLAAEKAAEAERLAKQKAAEAKRLADEKEKQRLAAEQEAKILAVIKNIEFVKIPAGQFKMGEKGDYPVTISKDFYLGKYLVTQAQWTAVMGNNPSNFKGDDLPVECVSWFDAQEFIERLNAKTGLTYGLPTEAEWEYACRAGTTTPYYTGNDIISKQANFVNCVGCTTPVDTYPPNPWGLYDMAGNVWEWTDSIYVDGFTGAEQQHSSKNNTSSQRVLRGGSWFSFPLLLRSASRYNDTPDERTNYIGFRLFRM